MATEWTPALRLRLEELARSAGFDLAGVAAATGSAAERFTEWVAQGRAGEMEYLKRRNDAGVLLRTDVRVAVPWARSVVVCATNYNAAATRSIDPAPAGTGWVARYAWSGQRDESGALRPSDYHDDLLERLRKVETGLRAEVACETRCYVDTGPILERDFAAKAGIGWIGKNTCVLNQQLGSWLLLGVIVCSLPVTQETQLTIAADRCGSCTRCIDACPTDALLTPIGPGAPRAMDASLCIAYLTIEKKGSIPEALREPMGRQVFGCDICQEVCPWNRKAPIGQTPGLETRAELVNPSLGWFAELDAKEFKRHFKGSPLERTRLRRLHRNTAIAMGNSGDTAFLPQLRLWELGDDPVLAETAAWARRRMERAASISPANVPV